MFFHCAQQRVLLLLRNAAYLGNLGLGDFIAECTADSLALGMYLEHNPSCLAAPHAKYRFENFDNKFHWRVVVINQDHAIQWWTLELGICLFDGKIMVIDTRL